MKRNPTNGFLFVFAEVSTFDFCKDDTGNVSYDDKLGNLLIWT